MKLTTLTVAFAALLVLAQSAEARGYRGHHHRHAAHLDAGSHFHTNRYSTAADNSTWRPYADAAQSGDGGQIGGRPAAWCGWEMRQLVSSDPGPEFNLARNWPRWGHAGPASIGAVIVWSHHVGKIVGQEGDMWVIESGNDGHGVRIRARSIAGAIAIRWG